MPEETRKSVPIGPRHIGQVEQTRQLLDIVDRVHSTGVRAYVDVPAICVLGDQSVGKSSVIESISGIKLPRALDTCTRCVMHCRLSRSSESWKCTISLNISASRSAISKKAATVQFGEVITDRSRAEERIRRAQRALLSPNTDRDFFLNKPEEEFPPTELTFTSDSVQIEISDSNLTNLSFFDLPGLIANAEKGNEGDIQLVENVVSDYISRDSCLILLTIACEYDFMTQKSYQLAQKHDPNGARTIGVLTKPDRCPEGSGERWLDFVRRKRSPILRNGWFVVKRPDTPGLLSGITWEEAQSQEEVYFSTKLPWCAAELKYRSNYGSQNLVRSLSVLLCEVIKRRLPELQHELRSLLSSTRASLAQLPEQTKNHVAKASKIIGDFLGAVEKHLEGAPGKDGLHQSIRQPFNEFTTAIRASVPDFRPYPSSAKDSFSNEAIRPYGNFVVTNDRIIYSDEVKELANMTRSRELPDHCPFQLLEDFANKFVERWEAPADALLDEIYRTLRGQLNKIISQHFPDDTYPVLSAEVKRVVKDILLKRRDAARERVKWQIDSERKGIFTLNEEDLYSYKTEFVSACKIPLSGTRGKTVLDVTDPVVNIMGSVRGYFHVSHKRFLDNVPLAVNHELVYGLIHPNRGALHDALYKRLGIDGAGADARCEELLQEPPNVQMTREALSARHDMLSRAATELEEAIY